MSQNFHDLWSHLIWSTKYRERLITPELKWPLYNKVKEICKGKGYYLDHINGIEDHIHLLIELKPKFNVSDVVKNIKGLTWEWLRREELSENYFSWQDGFAAISVSPKLVPGIRKYIQNQEVHHQEIDLEEELKRLKVKIYRTDDG